MKDALMLAQDFVGIPWIQDFGDDPEKGMDCYSFARYFLKEAAGLDIPQYKYSVHGCMNVSLEILKHLHEGFIEVPAKERKPFDLVLMRYENHPCHAAVYLGYDKLLHCDDPESAILNYSDKLHLVSAGKRIEGYYRCR